MTKTIKPIILCILDGWGYSAKSEDNAIAKADTPNWDSLLAENPSALLQTSGSAVGLHDGQMGNSEVGHLNIGAGRVVYQDLVKINKAIDELPDKYRTAIILRHREEKSYDEIAEELNLPLGTVKARIFRAREMLKKSLKDITT